MKRFRGGKWTGFVMVLGFLGCGQDHSTLSRTTQALPGRDSFLYFRCNSTGWNPSAANQLKSERDPYLFELSFQVTQPWMLTSGDECMLTETPEQNGWGSWSKNFGPAYNQIIQVPGSSFLNERAENPRFKVVFPKLGRYRVIANWRQGGLIIQQDEETKSGNILWTAPTNLSADAQGNLYMTTYAPDYTLARLNKSTGSALWQRRTAKYTYLNPSCAFNDVILVKEEGEIVGLSPASGETLWTTNLEGRVTENDGYVHCFARGDFAYVTSGENTENLSAVRKATGAVAWTYPSSLKGISLSHLDATSLVLTAHDDNWSTSLIALDLPTGKQRWAVRGDSVWPTFDAAGNIFQTEKFQLRRIDRRTGLVMWTYRSTDEYFYLTLQDDGLFVHEQNRISRLDKDSGKALWDYQDENVAKDSYLNATLLKTGSIVIRSHDSAAGPGSLLALSASHGKLIWRLAPKDASSYLTEDDQKRVYLVSANTLSLLDSNNGQILWSYVHTAPDDTERLMYVLTSDQNEIFLAYSKGGYYKYPPMGLIALERASGISKWNLWLNEPFSLLLNDPEQIFVNSAFGSAKAIAK